MKQVTAVHPKITSDEKEKRMKRIEDAIRKFWIAKQKEATECRTD